MARAITISLYAILIISIFSCSEQWHLKQSQKHMEKAIKKGYSPLYDTSKINSTIQLRLTNEFKTQLNTQINNIIDSSKNEIGIIDELRLSANIVEYINTEVLKHVDLDSTLVIIDNKGDSIGFISLKADSAGLQINAMSIGREVVFIELNPIQWTLKKLHIDTFWEKLGFWSLIALIIIIIIAIFIGRIMK